MFKNRRCPPGVFPALAFVADFPPVAPEFHRRTSHVRLRNLDTTDKKSSHKIKHRKIPREHLVLIDTALKSCDKAIFYVLVKFIYWYK